MDSYEATRMVYSRIQSLDPENASKIMGYLLIQDQGDKEMIRLAFGPENLIQNLIFKAKTDLGLLHSTSSTTTPTPTISTPTSSVFSPISRPNPSSPASNASSPAPWSPHSPSNGFASSVSSLSYASIVNGTNNATSSVSSDSSHSLPSSYYNNVNSFNGGGDGIVVDDYSSQFQLQEHLSFLNETKGDDFFDPRLEYTDSHLHRRSFSVPGLCFGSDDVNSGLGWKQCLYYAKGFCKNGTTCKFLHGGGDSSIDNAVIGSPNKLNEFEQCHELLRSKSFAVSQQRKLAAASQFMGSVSFPYNKCMNFILQQQNDSQRSAAAALMMGDELHKFGRCRSERNHDFSAMNNPGSRQIYLTFPADSTFREEDVSNYFSIYGPVQDVRIPYQQKRMFGFVTFVYPETVKLILAKGNPHFVCDSRVLVKPYKEKGKVPEKKQHQHMERGEFSACSSPSGHDPREPFDFHLGARMFYNTQEMLLRRKIEEQADLQQAIELQGRRLMNLQLLDFKNNHNHHHQFHHNISNNGSPVPSPTLSSHTPTNKSSLIFPLDGIDGDGSEENNGSPVANTKDGIVDQKEVNPSSDSNNGNGNSSNKEEMSNSEDSDLHESLEHILPDNLFASPKKSTGDHLTTPFSASPSASVESTNNLIPSNSSLIKSCFLQMPRISSGQGTIGM